MYKESKTSRKEESLREESPKNKNPQISNQGVIIECNLLDNNNYNLEIR